MKHYGDITKMNGSEIEPVWLITGGSPCQDLSVAGKRAGLAGERSGLFMEMIRVIKEMRATYEYKGTDLGRGTVEPIRLPNWVLWENVPGALSSNSGEDFRCVLEELVHVKDESVVIPRPPKGKWANAGSIVGDGWSLAWRIRDAQYWGVPQRRRRIALLVGYGGMDAAKILFEQCSGREPRSEVRSVGESMSGDSEKGSEEGQSTSNGPPGSIGVAGCLNPWDVQSKHIQSPDGIAEALYSGECRYGGGESYVMDERPKAYTLKIRGGSGHRLLRKESGERCADTDGVKRDIGSISRPNPVQCMNPWDSQSARVYSQEGAWHGLSSNSNGGQSLDAVLCVCPLEGNGTRDSHRGDGYGKEGDPCFTLNSVEQHAVAFGPKTYAVDMGAGKSTSGIHEELSPTLATTHYGEPVINDTRGFGETGQGYWQFGIQALRAEGENRPSRPSNVIVENDEE